MIHNLEAQKYNLGRLIRIRLGKRRHNSWPKLIRYSWIHQAIYWSESNSYSNDFRETHISVSSQMTCFFNLKNIKCS